MIGEYILMAGGAQQGLLPPACAPRYQVGTIAHHLAQINRFTGAANRPYSVAEHSLLCADIAEDAGAPAIVQLCCLMHDAHECVVGDVSTPVKHLLGRAWSALESPHARALREHLGLGAAFADYRAPVHHADLIALATERRDLLDWDRAHHQPWPVLDTPGREVEPAPVNLRSLWREQRHWSEWREEFLERYHALAARAARAARQGDARACHPVQEATHA